MTPRQHHWDKAIGSWAALGLLLTTSACNTPGRPFGWGERERGVQHAYRDEHQPAHRQVQPLTHEVSDSEEIVVRPQSPVEPAFEHLQPFSSAKLALEQPVVKTPAVKEAAGKQAIVHEQIARQPIADLPAANRISPASLNSPAPWDCPPGNPSAANCPTGNCPPTVLMPCGPQGLPEYFAEEYICDGGDLNLPVHYEGKFRAGLDTEDTVAEYSDEFGRAYVKPSTRVCIYAPRFAAVRSASLPHQGVQVNRATGYHEGLPVAKVDARTLIETKVQNEELIGLNTRARAGGVDADQWGGDVSNSLSPARHVKLLNAFEDRRFQPGREYDSTLIPIIGQAAAFAGEWSQGRVAVIIAKDDSDRVIIGRSYAQDYTAIELRDSAGDLTIVKVADKAAAQPGDVVTFTIRFDNIGGRPLLNVRVVDNLSPRLEYIAGSVQCTLEGQMSTEPTDGGSTLLTFEFDQPLAARTGGSLTFQCRVR